MTNNTGPVVTFGATLARRMEEADMRQHFDQLPGEKAVGMVHIAVCKSHLPDQVNVECLLESMPPSAAVIALEVAAARLRRVYSIEGPHPAVNAIANETACNIMHVCDELVRAVRARPPAPSDLAPNNGYRLSPTRATLHLASAFIATRAMIEESENGG